MSLNDTINQGITDFGLLHQIVHGDQSQSVTTDGGPVATVANVVNGILGRVLGALTATSTTSVTIDSNDKVFSITTGKAFQIGQHVVAVHDVDNSITGTVVSYVGATLTIRPATIKGTGTFDSWNIVFTGAAGPQGDQGNPGDDGLPGKSAYEIAQASGFAGGQNEWLASLTGPRGSSAYEVAQAAGYTGSLQNWLTSLVGAKGNDGRSAYELAQDTGFTGTVTEWITSLHGGKGDPGVAGKSAYQSALSSGFTGSEQDWVVSLKGTPGNDGADGKSAYELAVANAGYQGTLQDWLGTLKGQDGTSIIIKGQLADSASLPADDPVGSAYVVNGDVWIKGDSGWFDGGPFLGIPGAAGRSAYQIALDNGFTGTEQDWLTSLQGAPGNPGGPGPAGKSAYQVAVDNGFNGTAIDFINSLKGEKGDPGTAGTGGGGITAAEIIFADSSTITPTSLDGSLGGVFTITLTSDLAIPLIVNPVSGQTYLIALMQNQSGNHKVTLDKKYKFSNNVAPVPSTSGSAIDLLRATYSSTGFFFCEYVNGYTITSIARIGSTPYDSVQLAASAVQDGQTIYITRSGQMSECTGYFLNDVNFTVAGDPAVTGVPTLKVDSTVHLAFSKAILDPEAGTVTIRDLALTGAADSDLSGAAIRNNPDTRHLRLERLTITQCQDGVLTSAPSSANLAAVGNGYTMEIVDCNFDKNGSGYDGQSHNIYLGHGHRTYVLRSRFTNSQHGHDFKTRASYLVLDRTYHKGAMEARELDVPNGGVIHAVNSYFIKVAGTTQGNLIGIGQEGASNTPQEYIFRNCLLENDQGPNFSETYIIQENASVPVKFVDCVFIGPSRCIMATPFELYYTGGPIGPEGWDQSIRGVIPKRGTYNTTAGNGTLPDDQQPVIVNGPDPTLTAFPPTGSTATPSVRPENTGPDTTPPVVTLTSSASTVSDNGNVTLTANATDNIGVTYVEFYRETALISTVNTSPFTDTVSFTSADNGTINFHAIAYDAAGNQTTSATIQITVNVLPPPTDYPFSMDSATTTEYNSAIANAPVGSKRAAGANAIANGISTSYHLDIYQETTLVVSFPFTSLMTVTDDGTNVSVSTPTPELTDPLVTADITSGTWHFELHGGNSNDRVIMGSVGPTGSGKMIEISDNPAPGTGMSVSFSMIVPRSVDGLT